MRVGTRFDRPLWMQPGPVMLGESGRQQPPCPYVAIAVRRHAEAIALPCPVLGPPADDLVAVAGHLIAVTCSSAASPRPGRISVPIRGPTGFHVGTHSWRGRLLRRGYRSTVR
jgi:hypothetical protein